MKAATFNVCTNDEQFPNHDNVTATVIDKLWVALEDDVYEKVSNSSNYLEMLQHGLLRGNKNWNCTRYILPKKEQIQTIVIGYNRKLWRYTYLQVSSKEQEFFTIGEWNWDTKTFEFNIENPIVGFKSSILKNKETGELLFDQISILVNLCDQLSPSVEEYLLTKYYGDALDDYA